jgi:3-deoxy-D-manno-octulosonic-acid transferase
VPVVIGPNNQKFQEARELLAKGGCFQISSYEHFEQLMNRFENEPEYLKESGEKASAYVESLAGATRKILSVIHL